LVEVDGGITSHSWSLRSPVDVQFVFVPVKSTDAIHLDQISQLVNVLRVLFVIAVDKKNRKRQRAVLASYRPSLTPCRSIRRTVIIIQFFHRKMFVKGE